MTTLAEQLCAEKNVGFGQAFRYQYVIAPQQLSLPDFETTKVGAHFVHIGAALRHARLVDRNGVVFGLCLGIAVDHDGALPEEALRESFDSTAPDALHELEHYLVNLAGRYAIVSHLAGKTQFHCDPVGMIGAVYAPETGRIGASTFLCIDREVIQNPLYDPEEVAAGTASYGFSHTPDARVFRMNASHRMPLATLQSERFWPFKEDRFDAEKAELGPIYDEMITATQEIMTRMNALGPTSLPLTGGNDSRILLALAGDQGRSGIAQYFSHINNYANRRDAGIGAKMCAAVGMTHEAHDRRQIKVPRYVCRLAARRYVIASGALGAVPKEIHNGLFASVTENAIVMRGHQTNIMRGQYLNSSNPQAWARPDWQILTMAVGQNGRSEAETVAAFTPEFEKYYNDLPDNAKERSADFIFFETLVPAALGVLFPGQDHAFYLSPFNSRRLVQISMMPDTQYRRSNLTTYDLLLRANPDIAYVPFSFELPADLAETPDSQKRRDTRMTNAIKRHQEIFGAPPSDTLEIIAKRAQSRS